MIYDIFFLLSSDIINNKIKIKIGPGFEEVITETQQHFKNVGCIKPRSCRPKRVETFILARGLKEKKKKKHQKVQQQTASTSFSSSESSQKHSKSSHPDKKMSKKQKKKKKKTSWLGEI